MKRIQIFSLVPLLLFLGLAVLLRDGSSASAAEVAPSSDVVILPVPSRPSLDEPKPPTPKPPASCPLSSAPTERPPSITIRRPRVWEEPSWTPEKENYPVPEEQGKASPSGVFGSTATGYAKSDWGMLLNAVAKAKKAASEKGGITKTQKSYIRADLRAARSSIKGTDGTIGIINTNEKAYATNEVTRQFNTALNEIGGDFNKDAGELVSDAEKDLVGTWEDYWEAGNSVIDDEARDTEREMAKATRDINSAKKKQSEEKQLNCQNLDEIEIDRDERLTRVWSKGDKDLQAVYARSTNEVGTIRRKTATQISLEEITAQEEIENIDAAADAEIIQIIEQYEGDKIDEINATNDEIASISLTAEDDKKVEKDTADASIEEITTTADGEITDVQDAAKEERSTLREDASTRKTEVEIEFRDARSSLDEGLQTALSEVTGRWRGKIAELRRKVDAAKQVLNRRPGANWAPSVRKQLLQAQRRAENIYARAVKALRAAKAKRDSQLAGTKKKFQRKVTASKKAEQARLFQIERDYQSAARPINEDEKKKVDAIETRRDSSIRVIEQKLSATIAEIDNRTKTQVSGLTKTLSEALLRLDRQKTNEAGTIDRQRTLEVTQRERAKARTVAELQSEAEIEAEGVVATFDEEVSGLQDEVSTQMSDIRKEASASTKDENARFKDEVGTLEEEITDASDDIETAQSDFEKAYRENNKDWKDESEDIYDAAEEELDSLQEEFDDAEKDLKKDWGRGGSEYKDEWKNAETAKIKNPQLLKKAYDEGMKYYNKIKIKKKEKKED